MKPVVLIGVFILSIFLLCCKTPHASKTKEHQITPAGKLLAEAERKQGLTLKPHASVNAEAFAMQYKKNSASWDKAFAFLKSTNFDTISPGKYFIDGQSVFATVTQAPSKKFENAAWESHRRYVDLQLVINGKEKIGVAPVATATVIKPYDPSKDIAYYATEGNYYLATPGTFFLFFPTDAHRPNIQVEGYDVVKKLVIKVAFEE